MSALASHRRPGETWADMLPRLQADREAWQAEHGPALKALDEQRRKEHERATTLVSVGLKDASDEDRALVAKITGLALSTSQKGQDNG